MSIIIIKTFMFTLLFTLSFAPAPQLGSDDSLSPSLSPPAPSPESDLTPPPSSPPADTPSPADAPFAVTPAPEAADFDAAENVKSEERKESGSGGIVVGVVAAVCVVGLGHLGGVLYNKRQQNIRRAEFYINQPNPQGNMADNHHINQPNHRRYLFFLEELGTVYKYILTVDNNNFLQERRTLTPPEPLRSLTKIRPLDSINGILCFFGDVVNSNIKRAVMYNPIDGGYFPIDVIPKQGYTHTVVGFGVYRHPMFVKISVREDFDGIPTRWEVDVFSLGTRNWRNVYNGPPLRPCKMECAKVCINGVIYFRAFQGPLENRENFFISLDLRRMIDLEGMLDLEMMGFGEVDGSLGLLEYHLQGFRFVCRVWAKAEGDNQTFTERCTVEDEDLYGDVLAFRNNGQPVLDRRDDARKRAWCRLVVGSLNEPMAHEWRHYAYYPPRPTLIEQIAERIAYVRPIFLFLFLFFKWLGNFSAILHGVGIN